MGSIKNIRRSHNFKNLIGEIFNRLTVKALSEERNSTGLILWICECSCKNKTQTLVPTAFLRSGHTKSCGCLSDELTIQRSTTHNMSYSAEYKSWSTMKNRCDNPNCDKYSYYGGRGISYASEWETFEGFFASMGFKPGPKYSLDRIDNNGPYCKENCRWATPKEQARNKRNNATITFQGKTQPIWKWAEILGTSSSVLRNRRSKKWSDDRIITQPILQGKFNGSSSVI